MNDKTKQALELASEELQFFHIAGLARLQTLEAITAIRVALASKSEALAHAPTEREQPAQQQVCLSKTDESDTQSNLTFTGEPQAQQHEPVANGLPLVIAGAIFDFAGYLTTRDTVIEVGSTANASPVADLVEDWAALRGLSLEDAAVLSWQEWLTDVRTNDTSKERVDEMQKQRHDTSPPASKPWVGLADEDKQIAFDDTQEGGGFWEFADAIEAKLREKNA